MINTEELKSFLKINYDLDLVGIASADALSDEPEGHCPSDLLPGAKSIIVFGRSFADGAVSGMFRAKEDGNFSAQSAYQAYCDELAPNILLFNDAFKITAYLEDTFHAASVPCPFNVMQSMRWKHAPGKFFADPYGQGMPLDIGKAALAAGLGEFGWSNRFLTPEYGPRQMLTAVITTLELTPDSLYDGPALCNPEECGICAKVCPTGAVSEPCIGCTKEIRVKGRKQMVSDIDANACTVASLALRSEFKGRAPVPDLVSSNHPSDEELEAAFEKKPIAGGGMEHYPRSFCEKCLIYCPVGSWKERFSDTGLTSFKYTESGDQ